MPNPKLVRLALSCSFALAVPACADEEQSGGLIINYELGASRSTCADAEVVTMRANFNDLEDIDTCSDDGEFTASNIPARTYDFLLEGVDSQGVTVFDSLGDADVDRVTVVGGSTQTVDVLMSPTPAQVQVSFNLLDENGFAYTGTAESPVTEFEVIALDTDSQLLTHTFVVAELPGAVGNIVPDEGRVINGLRLNQVRIDYVANGSNEVVDVMGGTLFEFDPPGRGRLVDIIVRCEADVCMGELQGIEGGQVTTGDDSATGGSGTG